MYTKRRGATAGCEARTVEGGLEAGGSVRCPSSGSVVLNDDAK